MAALPVDALLAVGSKEECKMMLVAGYLHDMGKLAVKNDVLEKPSKLDAEEYNIIRSHSYYTYRLLQPIKAFEQLNVWAALHHERLDGIDKKATGAMKRCLRLLFPRV